MKRFVLTGTPGSGKTTVIEALRQLGQATVAEAATDVIGRGQAAGDPEPWRDAGFVDAVVAVQREREAEASLGGDGVCFFDRSPVCTLALSRFLGRPTPPALVAEIDRIQRARTYQHTVFFLANLGFVVPSAARRIDFEQALVFERVHRGTYAELGYQLIDVAVATPGERAAAILQAVAGS